jgi:hypothetical protein
MAEGRGRAEWARTAEVLAMIANCNRDAKRHPAPFSSSEFSPYGQAKAVKDSIPVKALKSVFVRPSRPKGG